MINYVYFFDIFRIVYLYHNTYPPRFSGLSFGTLYTWMSFCLNVVLKCTTYLPYQNVLIMRATTNIGIFIQILVYTYYIYILVIFWIKRFNNLKKYRYLILSYYVNRSCNNKGYNINLLSQIKFQTYESIHYFQY